MMKRMTTAFAAMSLLSLMPAAPAAADPANPPNLGIVDFCKVDVPANHPDRPLGRCVAFQSVNFRENLSGLIPQLCDYLGSERPDVFYANYDTFDECVRDQASAFLG